MSNGFKPGENGADAGSERATMRDIAWLAGVPKKTISRALDGDPRDRAAARAAILDFLRKADAPSRAAARPPVRPAPLIGLVYDAQNPERVVGWQDGMMEALEMSGFELVIRRVDAEDLSLFEEIQAFATRQKLAGLALASPLSNDERLVAMIRGLGLRYAAIPPSPARGARREGRAAGERLIAPWNG